MTSTTHARERSPEPRPEPRPEPHPEPHPGTQSPTGQHSHSDRRSNSQSNSQPTPRHVPLDPQRHAGLCVRTGHSADWGDGVMFAPVFPGEFRSVQAHYPVVFVNDARTGGLRPVALFGLEAGQNLFLAGAGGNTATGWDAPYIPLAMRMAPFLIGRGSSGDGAGSLSVHIDENHPRVSDTDGEALFDGAGNPAPALNQARDILGQVHEGEQTVAPFCALLAELGLLEPFTLDVTLNDGTAGRLAGYSIIAEETFHALDGAALARLHQAGALVAVTMAMASLSQFAALIGRRNALITADGVAVGEAPHRPDGDIWASLDGGA